MVTRYGCRRGTSFEGHGASRGMASARKRGEPQGRQRGATNPRSSCGESRRGGARPRGRNGTSSVAARGRRAGRQRPVREWTHGDMSTEGRAARKRQDESQERRLRGWRSTDRPPSRPGPKESSGGEAKVRRAGGSKRRQRRLEARGGERNTSKVSPATGQDQGGCGEGQTTRYATSTRGTPSSSFRRQEPRTSSTPLDPMRAATAKAMDSRGT